MEASTINQTLIERVRARRAGQKVGKENEEGLALLDVLIGLALFSVIAVIAVSALGQFRDRAYESGAVSDARQIGVALEAQYTDYNQHPDPGSVNKDAATANAEGDVAVGGSEFYGVNGVKLTKSNTVSGFTTTAAGTFSFCVTHKDGPWAKYDSAAGGVVAKDRSGTCS